MPRPRTVVARRANELSEEAYEGPMHHPAGRDLIENFASTFDSCNCWTKLVASFREYLE